MAGLQDLFSIERKTVSDLVGCCMGDSRDRFERELHRLRGYRFKRLLVVGCEAEILAGRYHSNIKPQAVLASVCAWECRFDIPVVFVPTAQGGARLVERWAFYFARETVTVVNSLWRGEDAVAKLCRQNRLTQPVFRASRNSPEKATAKVSLPYSI